MATSATATGVTRYFLEALGKFATARLRRVGALRVYPQWEARAAVCERCPLRVIRYGVSYCGTPLLRQIDRDPAIDGCGCPCHDKAKSAQEHCPIDGHHQAAVRHNGECSCKWCAAKNSKSETRNSNQIQNSKSEAMAVSSF
ncbi:MAG: hypothetical protein ABSB42_05960 [Tepidisphaeraceae bacterium]|jgi:hypothetical protein